VAFPPLGLLKLATYYRQQGHEVFYQDWHRPQDWQPEPWAPDRIEVTSLWTWDHARVHKMVRLYRNKYPSAEIRVGGIYASLMPEHAAQSGATVVVGSIPEVDICMPAYDLVDHYWDKSLIYTSRGCPNNCPFCAVPKLEGPFRVVLDRLVDYGHWRIIPENHREVWLLDNNFLAGDHAETVFHDLIDLGLRVKFVQGLDFKLLTPRLASLLAEVRRRGSMATAIDQVDEIPAFERGLQNALDAGIHPRSLVVYLLYNFTDQPEDLLMRMKYCLEQDIACYPMRYQPLRGPHALRKDSFVGPHWDPRLLEMVASCRRKIGVHGAIVPNKITKRLILPARTLREAMTPFKSGGLHIEQSRLVEYMEVTR